MRPATWRCRSWPPRCANSCGRCDTVARFGGEEFVVLLPDIDTAEAQKVLTRLQRSLTASLFMHDNKEVFVTFSAGVTALRDDEALEAGAGACRRGALRGQAHRQEPHLHRLAGPPAARVAPPSSGRRSRRGPADAQKR